MLSWPGWLRCFARPKTVTRPIISCGGRESNSRPTIRKSNALTTRLPTQLQLVVFGVLCAKVIGATSSYDGLYWSILTCDKKLASSQLNLPHGTKQKRVTKKLQTTRMWANAQRDGHPAEHRWRPLFNATKFG